MSDPLLDPRDRDLEDELLRAGRDVRLSANSQARILASLGIAAGGLTVASKAAASTGLLAKVSSFVSGKSALLAAGIVSVGAIGGGAWYVNSSTSEPVAPRVVEAQEPAKKVESRERPAVEQAPTPSPEVEPEAPTPSKPRSQAPSTPERSHERSKTLGDELAVVESASRALRSGNPQAALGRLAEYRQRFPRGKLALEAQVLRIEALARAGRSSEAARLARGFLKRHPNSPVAARIRRYAE